MISLMTPREMAQYLAKQAKTKRLSLNFSQQTLADRSGVSYGTLKKFEQTGKISLGSLLKLAVILDSFEEFKDLFPAKKLQQFTSLDEMIKDKPRKRGRE